MRCVPIRQVALAMLVAGSAGLSACGHHAAPGPMQDKALDQAANAGRQSLSFHRTAQAVEQYQKAFTLALARNDAQAIGDCGYDLAVAQLADNHPDAALATALVTRDALAARSAPGFAELDLAQAAALHRLGRDPEADILAAQAQNTANDPATIVQASYVRGLIAYDRGDQAGLVAALDRFVPPEAAHKIPADWQANHDELTARLDLLRGQYRPAARLAVHSADIHRTQLDYQAMAEMLALAAGAMQQAGDRREAADLYLQAGQSEATRGDPNAAIPLLRQVLMPGADPASQRTAQETLAPLLRKPPAP